MKAHPTRQQVQPSVYCNSTRLGVRDMIHLCLPPCAVPLHTLLTQRVSTTGVSCLAGTWWLHSPGVGHTGAGVCVSCPHCVLAPAFCSTSPCFHGVDPESLDCTIATHSREGRQEDVPYETPPLRPPRARRHRCLLRLAQLTAGAPTWAVPCCLHS